MATNNEIARLAQVAEDIADYAIILHNRGINSPVIRGLASSLTLDLEAICEQVEEWVIDTTPDNDKAD